MADSNLIEAIKTDDCRSTSRSVTLPAWGSTQTPGRPRTASTAKATPTPTCSHRRVVHRDHAAPGSSSGGPAAGSPVAPSGRSLAGEASAPLPTVSTTDCEVGSGAMTSPLSHSGGRQADVGRQAHDDSFHREQP